MDTYKAPKETRAESSVTFFMTGVVLALKPALVIIFDIAPVAMLAEFLRMWLAQPISQPYPRRSFGFIPCQSSKDRKICSYVSPVGQLVKVRMEKKKEKRRNSSQ
jgi:hypothetical protein